MLKVKMKKLISAATARKKPRRSDSRTCLMENNNNSMRDGYANPLVQNTVNTEEEKHLQQEEDATLLELFGLLGAYSDATTSEDGPCCSGQYNMQLRVGRLIKKFLSQSFPKPPADLDRSLQLHLLDVEKTVFGQLERLGPLFQSRGMMGFLVDCYHRHTFDHLHGLIQNVSSSKSTLVLMNWVVNTYLRQEIPGRPDRLFSDWEATAKKKLLEHVQKEIRETLNRILQNERGQKRSDDEEAYEGLYVDTIQCVAVVPRCAGKISSELRNQVQEVCSQELLTFVTRYAADQKEFLGSEAEADQPETIHFLKTLKTCKELRQHVQNEGIETSLLTQTVATLEDMEAFTLKLLREVVADMAESHLRNYFKSDSRRFYLFSALENLFPKRSYALDEQKRVMDEAYEAIAHVYLKHLIKSSRRKLKKRWSPNVEQTVREDAEQLHSIMTALAPGVQQWNQMLLKIPEVLECKCIDALKMTVAHIEEECSKQSEDLELLPALLRWKGHSKREVREVMEALPSSRPGTGSGSWFSCLICC